MARGLRRNSRPRALRCALAACAALAAAPAAADASTYYLQPSGTTLPGGWTATPGGTPEWEILNDGVLAPSLPGTASDYLTRSGSGTSFTKVSLSNVTLQSGETADSATVWAYLDTAANRTAVVWVTGEGGTALGSVNVPSGSVAGWRQIPIPGPISQTRLDALEIGFTDSGNGSVSHFYAAYAQVATTDPPPPPPPPVENPPVEDPPPPPPPVEDPPVDEPPVDDPVDPPVEDPVDPPVVDPPLVDPPAEDPPADDPPAEDPPADPVPTSTDPAPDTTDPVPTDPVPTGDPPIDPVPDITKPALDIAGTSPTATPNGDVPIGVECPDEMTEGCQGVLWLEEPLSVAAGKQISAARRGPRKFSRNKRYELNPGQRKTVPVRLDRRVHRKFKRKRSFKVAVVAQQKNATGQVVTQRRVVRVFNKNKGKRR